MPTDPKADRNLRRRSTPAPRVTALISLAATLMFTASGRAGTTTINAKSASQSDVAAAIASAADGDTVTIPGGTATWTRTLPVMKAITLQGSGVGVTIIKDSVQSGRLIQWTLAAGYPSRLSGIEFQDGGRTNRKGADGILHVDGLNTNGSTFRFDHCKWNNLNGPTAFDTVIGVIDHNTFMLDKVNPILYLYGTHWDGENQGDGSWAAPTGFGSSQFLFIEDNNFTHSHQNNVGVTDAYAGARYVFRHNTVYSGIVGNHGTESTGRARGCRAMEIYSNTYTGGNFNRFVSNTRSGTVLFHDNAISGYWGNSAQFSLQNFRNFHPFKPWGGADGTNVWDVNDPRIFFTGTAAANSSGTTVTVSSANWSTNQWAGYTIRRTSDISNSRSLNFGWILSNTSNAITYTDNGGYGGPLSMSFCTGDSLEIRKVDHALDQPGRALGSLITGDQPVRPRGWNDQVTEPCYSWNNTNEVNGQVNFSAAPGVRAGVHFFNSQAMPGYTPYTYPHPLTKGLPPPEQTTRNATANSQHVAHKERRPWGGKEPERKKAKKAKENPTNEIPEGQENVDN